MKEQQKHRDAFEFYLVHRFNGMAVVEAINEVVNEFECSVGAVYSWKKNFDWDGREAIRTHDVQNKIAEKTNNALADNKAWYLRITHDAIRRADENNIVQIENARDYDTLVKQALTIQGDDDNDTTETVELLRGLLNAITKDTGGTVGVGIKRRFDDKGESESS